MSDLRQYDYGTVIKALIVDSDDTPEDISSATSMYFYFKKPSGSSFTREADFWTDGTDGYIQYTIASGELDEAGIWSVQSHVITSGGSWKSTIPEFIVRPNII